jgi:hypothetical protein
MIFSNESVEGFRKNGKPFLLFMLSSLQIILIIVVWRAIKKRGEEGYQDYDRLRMKDIEKTHNVNFSIGGYYWVMKCLNGKKKGWKAFEILHLRPGQPRKILSVPQNKGLTREEIVKKVKFKYRLITFLMFIFPLINVLINLLYVIEYTLPITIPIPEAWLNYIQSAVKFLEMLWQYPLLAIVWCLFEIAISISIYKRIFGLPSPINFFKSVLSKL